MSSSLSVSHSLTHSPSEPSPTHSLTHSPSFLRSLLPSFVASLLRCCVVALLLRSKFFRSLLRSSVPSFLPSFLPSCVRACVRHCVRSAFIFHLSCRCERGGVCSLKWMHVLAVVWRWLVWHVCDLARNDERWWHARGVNERPVCATLGMACLHVSIKLLACFLPSFLPTCLLACVLAHAIVCVFCAIVAIGLLQGMRGE